MTGQSHIDAIARRLPRREASFDDAPCVGEWASFDLPTDRTLPTRGAALRHFAPAIEACNRCPLTGPGGACEQRVAPVASYFDGVCAGLVYRNGVPLNAHPLEVAS